MSSTSTHSEQFNLMNKKFVKEKKFTWEWNASRQLIILQGRWKRSIEEFMSFYEEKIKVWKVEWRHEKTCFKYFVPLNLLRRKKWKARMSFKDHSYYLQQREHKFFNSQDEKEKFNFSTLKFNFRANGKKLFLIFYKID